MKNISTLVIGLAISIAISAQSVSPEVVASAGDYFEGTNASLSWTLGEIATETYSAGNIILTQGFQQPISVTLHGIDLDLLVFLEGPYTGSEMSTTLNSQEEIPLSQPYNTLPWDYDVIVNVDPIPPDVVDWILVELRDAASPGDADPSTEVATQVGFLLKDGSIVGLDGSSVLQFPPVSFLQNLYSVVYHRNHLGIMSANELTQTAGVYEYDFSTAVTQVYNGGLGYKEVIAGSGVYGMVGGDADPDGDINASDKALWTGDAGTKVGYKGTDHNMDTQVDNKDKNDTWAENDAYSSQIPE